MAEEVLSGLKVLDLTSYISGPYCTKLLAEYGMEVVKVEKPDEGDKTRKLWPFLNDESHPEKSLLFALLNMGKKSITLNIETETGVEIVKKLAKDCDILVENFSPGVMARLGLDYDTLSKINRRLVMASITSFGQTGPYRDYKAYPIVIDALNGQMYITGKPDREPLRYPSYQMEICAGAQASIAILAALFVRGDGCGQYIDVSAFEGSDIWHQWTVGRWSFMEQVKGRHGGHFDYGFIPMRPHRCKDGYVTSSIIPIAHWTALAELIDRDELKDPKYIDAANRWDDKELIDQILDEWTITRTRSEVESLWQERRCEMDRVMDMEELLNDEHLKAREYWVELDHPVLGKLTYPGAPFKMSETPAQFSRAPMLGEHNVEIYCERLGYTNDDLGKLKQQGVI